MTRSRKKSIRVLHLNLAPPGTGGIERLLVSFFDCLHGDDFDISLCILDGESDTGKRLAARGCKIWTLHRRPDGFDRSIYPRLTAALREHRPDVVHLHGAGCLIFGVPAARWAGVRNLVFTSHSSGAAVLDAARRAGKFASLGAGSRRRFAIGPKSAAAELSAAAT